MMCANDTRKIFRSISSKSKEIFARAEKNERRKLFIRERERGGFGESSNKESFFAAIVVVPQNFLFLVFLFLPLLLLFQQAVVQAKRMKSLV